MVARVPKRTAERTQLLAANSNQTKSAREKSARQIVDRS